MNRTDLSPLLDPYNYSFEKSSELQRTRANNLILTYLLGLRLELLNPESQLLKKVQESLLSGFPYIYSPVKKRIRATICFEKSLFKHTCFQPRLPFSPTEVLHTNNFQLGLSNVEHNVIYGEVELIVFHMGFGISDKMELEAVEYIVLHN